MSKIFLTKELMETLIDLSPAQEFNGLKLIEQGDWVDDGKYSQQELIFEYQNKFYSFWHGRSGSYFTEYFYDVHEGMHDGECTEVEQVEVTTKAWKAIQ